MKNLLLSVVVGIQGFYLWALYGLVLALSAALSKLHEGDATLVAGIISEGIIVSVFRSAIGIIGLVVSLMLVFKLGSLPKWFKLVAKYLSYFWIFFIPVGTLLGIIQLKRLNR